MASQPESEWDATEQAWMLGLDDYRRTEQCPRCGGPKWICQSSESENAFTLGLPVRCHITTTMLALQEAYVAEHHPQHQQALHWPLKLRQSDPAVPES